jgi:hypothetical protein
MASHKRSSSCWPRRPDHHSGQAALSHSRRRSPTKPGCHLSSPRRPKNSNWTVA